MSCNLEDKRYELTLYVAEAGSYSSDAFAGLITGGKSLVGHVWYSIYDAKTRETFTYGFTSHGVTDKDTIHYEPTDKGSVFRYHMYIKEYQFNGLKEFGDHAAKYGFGNDDYNLLILHNNCIDFVYSALEHGYINTLGHHKYNHDALPSNNAAEFQAIAIYQNAKMQMELAKKRAESDPCPEESPGYGGAPYVKSPLAIDLDGDGVETIAMQNGVFFDMDNNGFAEKTGWIDGNDALLVIDRNGNGVIDNANELFGDLTASNGFEALKAMDSNGDGVIDANDAGWEELMLWVDAVNDGVSQSEELVSVKDAGIERIELNYQEQNVTDENGNQHRQTATVHWQDGHTTVIEDIWFQTNQAQSIDLTGLNVSDEEWAELAELPYIDAFGDVHSLWVAMSLDACNDEFFTKSSDFQAA